MQKLYDYIEMNLKPIDNLIMAYTSKNLDIIENQIQKKVFED